MIVINEKRNSGKTAILIELLRKDLSRILLVESSGEARRILEKYKPEFNITGRVMHWDYYLARPELWACPLLIDNVDKYLQCRFHSSDIEAVSINED